MGIMYSLFSLDIWFWSFNAGLLVLLAGAGVLFFQQARTTATMGWVVAVLLLTGLVVVGSLQPWQGRTVNWLFELDDDMNVPALFAAWQWFAIAVLFWLLSAKLSAGWLARAYL